MFSNLDIESKIWIFQTINPLSIEEENYIIKEIDLFLSKWTSHGNDLKSNYLIYKSHFIINLIIIIFKKNVFSLKKTSI